MRVIPAQRTYPPVLWSEAQGLAFFPVLKVAHSSLSAWLRERCGFVEAGELGPVAESWAVVRHPVARYVSALAQVHRMGYAADVPWSVFVDGVEAWHRRTKKLWTCRKDQHFSRQSHTLERMVGRRRLFRLEALDEFIDALAARSVNGRVPVGRERVTDPAQTEYALATLTPRIIELHYAEDLAAWEGVWRT